MTLSGRDNTRRPLLLIVEDNPLDLKIIRKAMSGRNVMIIAVKNGLDAFEFVSNELPDLILLDIMLPDIEGYEVCRRLKQDERTRDIPVIFITSKTGGEDIVRGFQEGAVDYISKPFNVSELRARVSTHLDLKLRTDHLRSSLREQNLLKQSIEAVSTGVTITDPEGHIVYTNPAEARMHGYDLEELIGKHVSIFSPPDREDPAMGEHEAPAGEWVREVENIRKDGSLLPVRLKSKYLTNPGGEPVSRISISEDITDQRRAREELRQSLERLEKANIELLQTDEELRLANIETIYVLTRITEYRDADTAQHIKRIGLYSRMLADMLGLDSQYCELIMYASPMHDVGKIGIPDALLLKNGPLAGQEVAMMKQHTIIGATLLRTNHKNKTLEMASEIALSHHERWDGSGYPHGLAGETIPLSARITTIADQYDALRSLRPYRKGFSHEETVSIMLKGDGRTMPGHFDPELLEAFRKIENDFYAVYEEFSGNDS